MKTIYNILKGILSVVLNTAVITYIYIRFIRIRLPNEFATMTSYQKVVLVVVTLGIIISIYNKLKYLNIIKQKKSRAFENIKKIILNLVDSLFMILRKNYTNLLVFMDNYIIYTYNIFIVIARKCYTKNNKLYYTLVIIFFEFIPKILFHCALFIDIVYLKSFHYSYKCMFVLLLPLLMELFLFIMKNFFEDYYLYTKNLLDIQEDVNGQSRTISFKDKESIYDIHFFLERHFWVLHDIPDRFAEYYNIKNNYLYYSYFCILLSVIKLFLFIYLLYMLDFSFIYNPNDKTII